MNAQRKFNPVWLVVIITLVVIGLAVIFFWDFVSENVILPIYTAAILAIYGINSVQQSIYLFFLILFAGAGAVIFLGSAFSRDNPEQYGGYAQYDIKIENPYHDWQIHCNNLARNEFANDEFARVTRNLLLKVLAYQEHRNLAEIENMVLREELELPPAVQHLLAQRSLSASAREMTWFQRQWQHVLHLFKQDIHTPTSEVIEEVQAILTFLEQRLEIHDHD